MSSTPARARTPNQTSTGASCRSRSSRRLAMMCQTAWMMSAASTASGRLVKTGVRSRSVTIVAAQVTRLATCERAPAASLTADADMLPAAIIPPDEGAARG